jgi:hypothetical protein
MVPQGSRQSIRRAVSLGCELVSARSDEPLRYRATDFSLRGAWLQTARPMRAGETVVVCFRLEGEDDREMMLFAEVARVMSARGADDDTPGVGMGLEWLDLDGAERLHVESFLEQHREPVPRRRRPMPAASVPPARVPTCWR